MISWSLVGFRMDLKQSLAAAVLLHTALFVSWSPQRPVPDKDSRLAITGAHRNHHSIKVLSLLFDLFCFCWIVCLIMGRPDSWGFVMHSEHVSGHVWALGRRPEQNRGANERLLDHNEHKMSNLLHFKDVSVNFCNQITQSIV